MLGMWEREVPKTRLLEGYKNQVKNYAEPEPLPNTFKLGKVGLEGERPAHQIITTNL